MAIKKILEVNKKIDDIISAYPLDVSNLWDYCPSRFDYEDNIVDYEVIQNEILLQLENYFVVINAFLAEEEIDYSSKLFTKLIELARQTVNKSLFVVFDKKYTDFNYTIDIRDDITYYDYNALKYETLFNFFMRICESFLQEIRELKPDPFAPRTNSTKNSDKQPTKVPVNLDEATDGNLKFASHKIYLIIKLGLLDHLRKKYPDCKDKEISKILSEITGIKENTLVKGINSQPSINGSVATQKAKMAVRKFLNDVNPTLLTK